MRIHAARAHDGLVAGWAGGERQEEHQMIRKGDTIHNPVTGERVTFLRTSRETNGESVFIEVELEPNGFVAMAHVHPKQSERFEVVTGRLGMKLGRRMLELGPGQSAIVEPGVPHKFWNAGDSEATFRTEVRPALQFEQLLETMFALAVDGKTSKRGMPNPLRLAVISNHHFGDVRLPIVPAWMQKLGLVMGAPIGRLVGYGPVYVPVPEPAAAA
jgi:mannose-6-phosphate isomerase-like protein (cupin superfamily)